MTSPHIVVDVSLAAAASLESQYLAEARSILESDTARLYAPTVLCQEYINGLLRPERRGVIEPVKSAASLKWLADLST